MPFIDRCPECPYAGKAVGTRGNPASPIVLVGEAPGGTEIDDGLPFVGVAGTEVLWPAVAEARLREADLYVVNSVACRPFNPTTPKVRTPSPKAILACHGPLSRAIGASPRSVIVALGSTAIGAVTNRQGYLVTRKEAGAELPSEWGTVVPTLHPAYVFRRGRRGAEWETLVEDLKHARRLAFGPEERGDNMRLPNVPEFRLRFPLSEVLYWASRYAYADDAEVEAIGDCARERGWFTRDEFLTVARWKSPRSRKHCEENDEAEVKAATQRALSTPDEREQIEALIQLHGVDYPTASVLLHLGHRDPYPIIDYRALWSLGVESPPATYSFAFWWAYTQACRSLATDAGARMRTFDRALWQFSKEHQPPKGTPSAPGHPRSTSTEPRVEPMHGEIATDVYVRLVEAAIDGHTIFYGALTNGRRVGDRLRRIADYEKAHGRPPLTAIVVLKQTGRPGEGFAPTMAEIGYARPGEPSDALWERAVNDVFEYWRP